MRDLSYTLGQTTTKNSLFTVSAFQINLVLVTCIVLLSLAYLFTINGMASAGMKIKKLDSTITQLELDHNKLELQNSSLQAVSTIQEATAKFNFVPTTNVSYIKDDNFALK